MRKYGNYFALVEKITCSWGGKADKNRKKPKKRDVQKPDNAS